MSFKKAEMTLKFSKCLYLEKLLLAYVTVLLMPYNFCNHNIFISLKVVVIFKVNKVIALLCIINQILHDILGTVCYLDDILVTGT